jgi:hypothetical protein
MCGCAGWARRRNAMLIMNRFSLLRLMGACVAGLWLGACATPPVSGVPVRWPAASFASVRAFAYDCDADESRHFFQKNGAVHRGILNGQGVLLSEEQVKRVVAALTLETPRQHRTACFLPHHSFVFYDAAGQVVAHTEVCFTCTIQQSTPKGLPEHINFQAVWDVLREMGVPCGDGSQFYKDLYKAQQAGR